jgi:hypothetical protein
MRVVKRCPARYRQLPVEVNLNSIFDFARMVSRGRSEIIVHSGGGRACASGRPLSFTDTYAGAN